MKPALLVISGWIILQATFCQLGLGATNQQKTEAKAEDIVILTPDSGGKAWRPHGESNEKNTRMAILQFLRKHSNAKWVPFVNNIPAAQFHEMLRKNVNDEGDLAPRISAQWINGRFLSEILDEALKQFLMGKFKSSTCIVKVDSAEHSIEKIADICEKALASSGAVVTTLKFEDKLLSAEEIKSRENFAEDLKKYEVKLPLTNTHGMWAMPFDMFKKIYSRNHDVFQAFTDDKKPHWGWDLGMILASVEQSFPVAVETEPGLLPRNSPAEKLQKQREDRQMWFQAYSKKIAMEIPAKKSAAVK